MTKLKSAKPFHPACLGVLWATRRETGRLLRSWSGGRGTGGELDGYIGTRCSHIWSWRPVYGLPNPLPPSPGQKHEGEAVNILEWTISRCANISKFWFPLIYSTFPEWAALPWRAQPAAPGQPERCSCPASTGSSVAGSRGGCCAQAGLPPYLQELDHITPRNTKHRKE